MICYRIVLTLNVRNKLGIGTNYKGNYLDMDILISPRELKGVLNPCNHVGKSQFQTNNFKGDLGESDCQKKSFTNCQEFHVDVDEA